ncbi:minor capsid protein [Scatolibacter rhodanostii]|uniref:minor capsid protein n=1 Tax=Scatolibacter rhodanostii TaxID=2014781 RepID=UPI000C08BB0A|nr:minor capsid protein [Scatolibacter rhodanostii]
MAIKSIIIKTPRGQIVNVTGKGGSVKAKFEWNKEFGAQKTELFSKAQKFLDSEVLRTTSPYVPLDTSMLSKSGQLGTTIGSGEVNYIAPYAAQQYYGTAQTRAYGSQRGGKWFERSKIDNKEQWIAGVKKIGGGK